MAVTYKNVGGQAPVTGPEAIKSSRRLAEAMLQKGLNPGPMTHWTQSLGSALQQGMGAWRGDMANREEADGQAAGRKAMAQLLAGGSPDAAMNNPYSADDALSLQVSDRNSARSAANQERLLKLKAEQQQQDPMYQAKLGLAQAQTAQLQQKTAPGGMNAARAQQLQDVGVDPASPEGQAFLLNGKLPAPAYEAMAQKRRRETTAPNIASGLQNLNSMTDQYNDASFSNSVGPFQGSTPDGLFSAAPILAARGLGEIGNYLEGGNANTSEVRNNIVGATETLAAAIKPLIRAPGEGVWTDQDQARLVAIVGDLSQASDKAEFKRRLNSVRDRIRTNFNLDIPFDADGPQKMMNQPLPQSGPADAGGFSIKRLP